MLIALFFIFIALAVITNIWVLVIIFRRSILGGLLSLFFGLPILYFLVTGWGKEGEDIRTPFFLSFLLCLFAIGVGLKAGLSAGEEAKQTDFSVPAAQSTPKFREPAPATDSARTREAPRTQPVAAPQAAGVPRPEAVKLGPSRQRPARSDCVYKPVMSDEDMAKCR
jgi:hypothetical protein